MFSKILVANRGEIAVKIINVCKSMGIQTVAIYSEADKHSLHVKIADESYCIGPASCAKSYLNMKAIISLAISKKVQAIHPGYGFLSENWKFAKLCEENNIKFIGPNSDILKKFSDKFIAKQEFSKLGIPTIPGYNIPNNDIDELRKVARYIGYPVIIKIKNGGGGRGIKIVDKEENLAK